MWGFFSASRFLYLAALGCNLVSNFDQ